MKKKKTTTKKKKQKKKQHKPLEIGCSLSLSLSQEPHDFIMSCISKQYVPSFELACSEIIKTLTLFFSPWNKYNLSTSYNNFLKCIHFYLRHWNHNYLFLDLIHAISTPVMTFRPTEHTRRLPRGLINPFHSYSTPRMCHFFEEGVINNN